MPATKKSLENALKFIHDNFSSKELSLHLIADAIYMSPYYFSRLFKQEMGISLPKYINQIRIQQACKLMKQNSYKLYEISEKVGYQNETYFNRIFKTIMGTAPKKYYSQL